MHIIQVPMRKVLSSPAWHDWCLINLVGLLRAAKCHGYHGYHVYHVKKWMKAEKKALLIWVKADFRFSVSNGTCTSSFLLHLNIINLSILKTLCPCVRLPIKVSSFDPLPIDGVSQPITSVTWPERPKVDIRQDTQRPKGATDEVNF